MLNCCIEHRKKREQLHKGYTGETYYSGSDFGPSTSRISRTFSDESGEMDEGEGGGGRGLGSSSDDDEEFFECDDEQTSEKKSENLSDEKDIDESTVDQSGDNARNQTETVVQCNDNLESQSNMEQQLSSNSDNQALELTCTIENSQSGEETESSYDNRSQAAQDLLVDNRNVTETENTDNQSENVVEGDNQSETVVDCDSHPRDSISSVSVQGDSAFQESFTHKPEGRLALFQDLSLVNCDERMYIPVTQEPAPMTEDMLEEHAEVLAK